MKKKSGFTIVEISLFLAITAAVFVGIAIGTQNSIFQQRYNDSVQNFAEFLRSIYSQVTNVQSEGDGRTDYAIYGKLVIFGTKDGVYKIRSLNVIGKVESECDGEGENTTILGKLLGACEANVIYKTTNEDGTESYKTVGIVEDYTPKWSAQIQTTTRWSDTKGYGVFDGALLVVRSPETGSVNTYVAVNTGSTIGIGTNMLNKIDRAENPLEGVTFRSEAANFCINPNGPEKSSLRRNVRIAKKARNSSGVVVVPDYESGCE